MEEQVSQSSSCKFEFITVKDEGQNLAEGLNN